ncbi:MULTISPECIES: FkbM family methyltransferase [unclassified Synechococcus]|uniref:FkbM family methyltransferase n=1 Tax=unclassified Synechococcus TaxID=2626047 RepID=UPI0039C48B35
MATAYNRQHLHWFAAAGLENLAWLPLISMRPITHEWVEARENQIVFIGQQGSRHPRRSRLVQALKEAGLPILIKAANRIEAAERFANSLISFNCSQNADLNLRNLEVISAGGFLLTDRLSFASGFDELLVPGTYCETYDSEGELLEEVRYYLDHPQEAIEIARRAYQAFDKQWHPRHRIQNLLDWVFSGELPEPFRYSPRSEVRHFVSTANSHLIDTRLAVYEPLQELHRVQERLKVFVGRSCPEVIAADLLDLPRLELYGEGSFVDPCALLQQRDVAGRVHELTEEPASWPVFDLAVCTVEDLQRLKQPLKANFAFVLGENHQLIFANSNRLMQSYRREFTVNQRSFVVWLYEEIFFHKAAYLNNYNLPSFISGVKTIADIGAGVGLASVYFHGFCPNAVIHCFEADPLALHLLQQNALILDNCHVHPVGLAGEDGYKTRRLWPEDSQTEWGVEQVLVFREARTALQELGLERIDVLRVATGGQEIEVLTSLGPWLKDIKVIYVEFGSEQDRKQIDQMLDPSHMIWQGEIIAGQRGSLCYLRRA